MRCGVLAGIIVTTPIALMTSVGPFGVVLGTAAVTLWYSSIVTLAKLFLDPLNNEVGERGGDPGIGGIEVSTLLQETNVGSERWRRSSDQVPKAALLVDSAESPPTSAWADNQPGSLMDRIFGVQASAPGGAGGDRDSAESGDTGGADTSALDDSIS